MSHRQFAWHGGYVTKEPGTVHLGYGSFCMGQLGGQRNALLWRVEVTIGQFSKLELSRKYNTYHKK